MLRQNSAVQEDLNVISSNNNSMVQFRKWLTQVSIKDSIVIFCVITSAEVINMELSQTIKTIFFCFWSLCMCIVDAHTISENYSKVFFCQNFEHLKGHYKIGNKAIYRPQALKPSSGHYSKTYCSSSLVRLRKTIRLPVNKSIAPIFNSVIYPNH